jgi:hypothetical protein
MKDKFSITYFLFSIITMMISNELYHSPLYSIITFFLAPLAWVKWVAYDEVTLRVVQSAISSYF